MLSAAAAPDEPSLASALEELDVVLEEPQAAGLLGVAGRFVAGKPLASFVAGDDRSRRIDDVAREVIADRAPPQR